MSVLLQKGQEDPGNYRLVSLTLIPGHVVRQILLDTISVPGPSGSAAAVFDSAAPG